MRSARVSIGRVEKMLLDEAISQMAAFYQLPCGAPLVHGDRAISPLYSGAMRTAGYVGALAGGLNISLGAGHLRPMVMDAVQLVIDDELLALAKRLFSGFAVNEDTQALDLVERIGAGGHYLTEAHTLRWLRHNEEVYSSLFHDMALLEGRRTLDDLAREKVMDILAEHQPAVPDEAVAAIAEYVQHKARDLM
jgi:trimethylamine--corrinoid protein Co-methyltransferase